MANTTLHWEIRRVHRYMKGAPLSVYLSYVTHANERGRAWPSVELLKQETGYQSAWIVKGRQWLEDHGALEDVPLDKRVGAESKVKKNARVMQVTGIVIIDGAIYQLLYNNQYTNSLSEISDQTLSLSETVTLSPSEISLSENEGSYSSLEGSSSSEDTLPLSDGTSDSAPTDERPESGEGTGKGKRERPANPLWDAIAKGSFGGSSAESGRIGKCVKAIKENFPDLVEQPELLSGFYTWYGRKHDNPIPPKDPAKLVTHLTEWRASVPRANPTQPLTVANDDPVARYLSGSMDQMQAVLWLQGQRQEFERWGESAVDPRLLDLMRKDHHHA